MENALEYSHMFVHFYFLSISLFLINLVFLRIQIQLSNKQKIWNESLLPIPSQTQPSKWTIRRLPWTNMWEFPISCNKIKIKKYFQGLAFSSKYFEKHLFGNPAAENNIELPESTTLEDFMRMLATFPPRNRQLEGKIKFYET